MNDKRDKDFVKAAMQHFNIALDEIPPKDEQTPDFACTLNEERYTIELKTKGDDPEEFEKFKSEFDKGGIVQESTEVLPRNRLDMIIKDGVKQMITHDPRKESFRIIWLHCSGRNPDIHWNRFHATLFGAESLISLDNKGVPTCYYFRDSTFSRVKADLDGAVLSKETANGCSVQLCLNSLGARYEKFKESELVKRMSKALCDPPREETRGQMIADCDIDRKNSAEVLKYLEQKYGRKHLQVMTMTHFSGTMKLPDDR